MAILKRRYGKRVMTHEQGWINFYLIPFRTMNLVVQIAGSLSKPKKCSVCRYFGCSRAANGKKRRPCLVGARFLALVNSKKF